jgi:hypothetical protein
MGRRSPAQMVKEPRTVRQQMAEFFIDGGAGGVTE